jgi:thiosulfate/3-mercaptopyruvate sulfurtransferase
LRLFRCFYLSFAAGVLALFAVNGRAAQIKAPSEKPLAVSDAVIPTQSLLQPEELAQMLRTSQKPLVLQVGSHVLYAEAHITGAEYVGAGGTSAGVDALRERVSKLKKDQPIVIYCGCCPWGHCPNIRPAYAELHALGFTQVKALYLPENFGADWVNKGYPVDKGR